METVAARVFCEPGATGATVAFWACLDPTKHDGYRLLLTPGGGGMDLVLQKSVGGVYTELGSHHEASGEEEQGVEMLVGEGKVQVKWNGAVVITVTDATYSTGLTGLEGEHENAFGTVGFTVNGILVDNLRRSENPLAFEKWVQLPWAANTGKCFSEFFGWVPNTGLSGAYWNEKGEGGGGEGGEEGGEHSLAAFLVNWEGEPGYYIHRGRVYLTGTVNNLTTEGGESGQTLLSGIPPAIRPIKNLQLIIPIICGLTRDVFDPEYRATRLWEIEVTSTGDILLVDTLPPWYRKAISEAERFYETGAVRGSGESLATKFPQYEHPLPLGLCLANVRWSIGPGVDRPTFEELPFGDVGPDFSATGPGYRVHGSRLHWEGLFTALVGKTEDLDLESVPATLVHSTPLDIFDATGNFSGYSTALLRGLPWALRAVVNATGGGVTESIELDQDLLIENGPPEHIPAIVEVTSGRWQHGIATGKILGSWASAQPGEYVAFGENTTLGGSSVCVETSFNPLTKTCEGSVESICHLEGGETEVTFDLATLMDQINPPPDLITVEFVIIGIAQDLAFTGECEHLAHGCTGGCVDANPPLTGLFTYIGGPEPSPTLYDCETGEKREIFSPAPDQFIIEGFTAPAVSYKGSLDGIGSVAPHPQYPFFWSTADAISFFAGRTLKFHGSGMHQTSLSVTMRVRTFYERRQYGLHGGDVLDLGITGWPSHGPTAIEATPAGAGVVFKSAAADARSR